MHWVKGIGIVIPSSENNIAFLMVFPPTKIAKARPSPQSTGRHSKRYAPLFSMEVAEAAANAVNTVETESTAS